MTEEKIIPKSVWKSFYDEYWEQTEYKDLNANMIKKILGKYLFVQLPKDVTEEKPMHEWMLKMQAFKEKVNPFGGYHWTLDEKGLNTKFGDIIGMKEAGDIVPTTVTKALWGWAREHGYAPKKKE